MKLRGRFFHNIVGHEQIMTKSVVYCPALRFTARSREIAEQQYAKSLAVIAGACASSRTRVIFNKYQVLRN